MFEKGDISGSECLGIPGKWGSPTRPCEPQLKYGLSPLSNSIVEFMLHSSLITKKLPILEQRYVNTQAYAVHLLELLEHQKNPNVEHRTRTRTLTPNTEPNSNVKKPNL
jgi:hypothetical protein